MKSKFSKFVLAATFGLALALTLSCSSGGDDNPPPAAGISSSSGGSSVSSSSGGGSSSSGGLSSSGVSSSGGSSYSSSSSVDLCTGFVNGTVIEHYGQNKAQFCDSRDGKKYVYVPIGEGATAQIWMAENLNYAVGGKCGSVLTGDGTVGDENTPACDKYGRLYNWATAMAIDASCNTSLVADCGATVLPKHRGICPEGWHIPSDADWNVLMRFVNPNCSDNSHCAGAGKKLKADSSLWNINGKGTDDYGFAALPGGNGGTDGYFYDASTEGNWWSSSEYSAYEVYSWGVSSFVSDAGRYPSNKLFLRSVRCVQD